MSLMRRRLMMNRAQTKEGFSLLNEKITFDSWRGVKCTNTADELTITKGNYTWTKVTSTLTQLEIGKTYSVYVEIDQSQATGTYTLYLTAPGSVQVKSGETKTFEMVSGGVLQFQYSMGTSNSGTVVYKNLRIEEVV